MDTLNPVETNLAENGYGPDGNLIAEQGGYASLDTKGAEAAEWGDSGEVAQETPSNRKPTPIRAGVEIEDGSAEAESGPAEVSTPENQASTGEVDREAVLRNHEQILANQKAERLAKRNENAVRAEVNSQPSVEQSLATETAPTKENLPTPRENRLATMEALAIGDHVTPESTSVLSLASAIDKMHPNNPAREDLSSKVFDQLINPEFAIDNPEASGRLWQVVMENIEKSANNREIVAKLDSVLLRIAEDDASPLSRDQFEQLADICDARYDEDPAWNKAFDSLAARMAAQGIGKESSTPDNFEYYSKTWPSKTEVGSETSSLPDQELGQAEDRNIATPASPEATQTDEALDQEREAKERKELLDKINEENRKNTELAANAQRAWNAAPITARNASIDLRGLHKVNGDVRAYMNVLETRMRTAGMNSSFAGLNGEGYAADLARKERVGIELVRLRQTIEQASKSSPEVSKGIAEMDKIREKFEGDAAQLDSEIRRFSAERPYLKKYIPEVMAVNPHLNTNRHRRRFLGLF